jgi:hypothetical protein
MPALNDSSSFSTVFSIGEGGGIYLPNGTVTNGTYDTTAQPLGGGGLDNFYPLWNYPGNSMRQAWYSSLAKHRAPADDLYLMHYRTLEEYQLLAASGAKWMNIAYMNCCPINTTGCKGAYSGAFCTEERVSATIDSLRPIVDGLTSLGLIDRSYVYGFDEMPRKSAIDTLYGAVKRAFPRLRTVATLASHFPGEYDSLPDDFPLDVWVQAYDWPYATMQDGFAKWRHSAALPGHANRDVWWYWSSAPQSPTAINTFIQRPALEARMLFWLAARHGIRGMLYYSIDQWASRCGLPSSVSEHPPQCSNISRLHGTGMTDFANNPMDGDGSLVYPGATGLVSSNRLEQIADGIEVWWKRAVSPFARAPIFHQ